LGLITANKRDSQGLCFIGKVSLPDFLQQKLPIKKGSIIQVSNSHPMYKISCQKTPKSLSKKYVYTANDGIKIGKHNGAHFFTVGQRKGLAIGGTKRPLFVLATDVVENIIYVGEGNDHPGLFRSGLWIAKKDLHWIRPFLSFNQSIQLKARIRYRQPLALAKLYPESNGMYIVFLEPQTAIAAGQFAVWYKEDELLGSGVIG
jgi:tRNA-specific 2-thiouridylase